MIVRSLTSTTNHRWIFYALLALFVGISVQYTIKITMSERDNRSAFLRWRDQINELEYGVNVYDKHNYPNPPIMAVLLQPLMALPPVIGSLLWFYLKVGMVLCVFHWVFRMAAPGVLPIPAWAKFLAVSFSVRPLIGDLTHGNINIYILFLVIGCLTAFRAKRDLPAGILLALAIASKVTPALFVFYFLWKRAWRLLAGCVAGLALFLWIIPGAYLGFGHNHFLLTRWTDRMVVPYVVEGEVTTDHHNQSLPGTLFRLTTKNPSFKQYDYEDGGWVPTEYHHVVSLPPSAVKWILKGSMVLFALMVIAVCRAGTENRRDWRLAAEYSLILIGMLLFSERTWKHHCVLHVLPFTVLAFCLACRTCSRATGKWITASLAVVFILIACTSSGLFGNDPDGMAKLAQVYGAYVWAHLILLAILSVILRQSLRQTADLPPFRCLVTAQRLSSTARSQRQAETPFAYGDHDGRQAEGVCYPSHSGTGTKSD